MMERMQIQGRLRGLGGEIYEAASWRSFQEGEKKKKGKPSFRWLQICLAAGSRDLTLPVHTEEGLISQGCCGGFGKVPLAAAGGLVPRPGDRQGDIVGRCSHRHCFPAWDPVCPAPKGSQGSKSSQKLQDRSRGCPLWITGGRGQGWLPRPPARSWLGAERGGRKKEQSQENSFPIIFTEPL